MKAKGAACLQEFPTEQYNRLETGIPWVDIMQHLHRLVGLNDYDGIEDGVSLVLDFCNDQGIAVPVTSVIGGVVFRAYRHGEDVKFTDAEVALAYQAVAGYLNTTSLESIPRLTLEKLLVLLMKIGVARGFMEPLFLAANGVQEVLRIGFYLHGAIPMLQRGPKDRADRDMWFSEHLRHKGVLRRTEAGQFTLGKPVDGNFRVTTAPDDAFEVGSIIGMLSKQKDGRSGPLDGRALTLLASCATPRHTAAAIQVELDIFRRWYEDVGRDIVTNVDWDDIAAVRSTVQQIITSKGYYALNEARLKFIGYYTGEPMRIVQACSEFLRSQGNELAYRKWNSFWSASRVLEASGEKDIFDKEIKEAMLLCWDCLVCIAAFEISLRGRAVELTGEEGDSKVFVDSCEKLARYGGGLSNIGVQPARTTSLMMDRFRKIEENPKQPWDTRAAVSYAQTVLDKTLPQVARQVEVMNPLIEEYGRLMGRRDYAYMVYYDIIDSTATKVASRGGSAEKHRARVRALKSTLSRGFDSLSQSAQKRASEVFCWNGAETSTNDCKHVFIGGTDATSLLNETFDVLATALLAAPGQRVRVYVIPCGFAGSSAYRTQWETEVSGERFWEHWSRLAKAAKAFEDSVPDESSFLLVATIELANRIILPSRAEWLSTVDTTVHSEIEGLTRSTSVRFGSLRVN